LARQEIWAELIETVEGSLWSQKLLDKTRKDKAPPCVRIGIGVDPSEGGSDEIGIVAMGLDSPDAIRGHGYVIADRSMRGKPSAWGREVLDLYYRLEADFIAVEVNRGGDMCAAVIRSQMREGEAQPRIIEMRATKGKATRAEPISGIWEEERIHMVGNWPILEDQLRTYVPGVTKKSPDRMDALVWVASVLFGATLKATPPPPKSFSQKPAGWA
jgi:phage terminase large subunit-like protein